MFMKKSPEDPNFIKIAQKYRAPYFKTLVSFIVDSSRKYFVPDNNEKKHIFILLTSFGSTLKRKGIVLFKAAPSIFSTVDNDAQRALLRFRTNQG